MSCRSENSTHLSLERDSKTLSDSESANVLKRFFTYVNSDILPFDLSLLEAFLPTGDMLHVVQSYELCKKLILKFSLTRYIAPIIFLAEYLKRLLLNWQLQLQLF